MKNKKVIFILLTIIILIVILVFVAYTIDKNRMKNNEPVLFSTWGYDYTAPVETTICEDVNKVWVGSFQLAWNELKDFVGGNIKFEGYESDLVNKLNTTTFNKDMLSEEDYYIKTGRLTSSLEAEIKKDLKNKFGDIERFDLLKNFEYNEDQWNYLIYSVISKEFEFLTSFDKLGKDSFKNSEEQFEYFGISSNTEEIVDKNVEVLFHNANDDFAVKLKTQNNEEVFLYRTENVDPFENLYKEMQQKNRDYKGTKSFKKTYTLKIPNINVNTLISYDELCNKKIEGTDDIYIAKAIQNVKFKLDENGGSIDSEAGLHLENYIDIMDIKEFSFTDRFIMFLKEADKDQFYMALIVDDGEFLKMS